MVGHLASERVQPELVLCSSGLRARQTLAAVLPSLGGSLVVRIEPALYTFMYTFRYVAPMPDAENALAALCP